MTTNTSQALTSLTSDTERATFRLHCGTHGLAEGFTIYRESDDTWRLEGERITGSGKSGAPYTVYISGSGDKMDAVTHFWTECYLSDKSVCPHAALSGLNGKTLQCENRLANAQPKSMWGAEVTGSLLSAADKQVLSCWLAMSDDMGLFDEDDSDEGSDVVDKGVVEVKLAEPVASASNDIGQVSSGDLPV